MDAAVEGMERSMGLSKAHKKNAQAGLGILTAGRSAEQVAGFRANGRDYEVDHVDRDGDVRKIYAHRRTESGTFEKVIVHEEQASEGAYVSKEIRYGR